MRTIEGHIQDAIIAPYDFLATGDIQAQKTAERSVAEARASLRILGNMLPHLDRDVGNTISALQSLESASVQLWDGHATVADEADEADEAEGSSSVAEPPTAVTDEGEDI